MRRNMSDTSSPVRSDATVEIDERTIGRILRDMGKLKPADEPREAAEVSIRITE